MGTVKVWLGDETPGQHRTQDFLAARPASADGLMARLFPAERRDLKSVPQSPHRGVKRDPSGRGKKIMTDALYDRLGGEAAVEAAVDIFYRKVLADGTINHFFKDTNMDEQRAKQKSFLSMAFGGPNGYDGKDLREAHAPLVEKGLNDAHFDAVAGHLDATLRELGVGDDLIGEVISIAAGTRNDILNK